MMDFDPDKIQNIISNLVSNAIHFTPPGGAVYISTVGEEGILHVEIKDTGPGISKTDLPKIFDRYFQAANHQENHNGGTGLGLALTKELVYLFKGNIQVKSDVGKGTTFFIDLPITNDAIHDLNLIKKEELLPISPNKVQITQGINAASDKMVLLIVEDNLDVVRYLYSLFIYRIPNRSCLQWPGRF
jgi:anti-sigma regulatory factor (Ser/Thr protein kinase)